MFEFVRTHNKLFFFVLVLLILPSFVFFGLQGYTGMKDGGNATVAEVDGRKITQLEWDAAHRQQVDQIQRSMPGVDAKLLDSPELKREALERLVRERVLFAAARKQHLVVTDDQLQSELMAIPQLAKLRTPAGGIDIAAYKALLQSQGLTPESFEASVRQDAMLRQTLEGPASPVPASVTATRRALEALLQRRQVQIQSFDAKAYAAKITPTDADLIAYHQANEAQFRTSEQAVIEYVVLDAEALKGSVSLAADDVKKYYEQNIANFTNAEERQASHILLKADRSAPADQRAATKAQAEALLAQVRKTPDQFSAIARKTSQDPGSAEQGGDLGFFGRNAMVKPFEDAAYAMKQGEISNVIESDFGFHIIRLTAIRGGEKQAFESVRTKIESDLKLQQSQKLFNESSETFGNLAYEQADSLQPLVERLKLTKRTATVARAPAPGASAPLNSSKLLDAVFTDDVLKNKRNSPAIETSRAQLTAARVTQHLPARTLALADVRDQVRAAVVTQQASALAKADGEAQLTRAKTDAAALTLPAAVSLSRAETQNQPPEVINAVMRAAASPLPQWVGVDLGAAGYTVVRINAVTPPDVESPEVKALAPKVAEAWSAAQAKGYLDALKKRFDAEVFVTNDRKAVDVPATAGAAAVPGKPGTSSAPAPAAPASK